MYLSLFVLMCSNMFEFQQIECECSGCHMPFLGLLREEYAHLHCFFFYLLQDDQDEVIRDG